MHFTQAQTHNNNPVQLRAGFIEALRIKTLICIRIPIPKDKLVVFTHSPSVTTDQTLEETVHTLFCSVVRGCFQPSVLQLRTQLPFTMSLKANSQRWDWIV